MKEKIAALMASSVYTEADRTWLESQTEDRLNALTAALPKPEAKAAAAAVVTAPVVETPKAEAPPAPKTAAEFIESAPQEIRDSLRAGFAAAQKHRADVTAQIKASKRNTFTDDQLAAKPVAELEAMAALIGDTDDVDYGPNGVRAAADTDNVFYNPPDPYAVGITALRARR